MSKKQTFDDRYKTGNTPWELERPDSNLIDIVKNTPVAPCKVLDIGCGTGSNSIWLAQNQFDVTGGDFSPLAIEKAKEKAKQESIEVQFRVNDFLHESVGESDFEFIFDRGCFHGFEKEEMELFAKNANIHLKKGGLWFSLLGNADDEPKEDGPPVKTALSITTAVEPYFEILSLASGRFDSNREEPRRCWKCLMRKR